LPPAEPSRRTVSPWLALLAATPVAAALYLLLPVDGPSRTIAYPMAGIAATVAILIGVQVNAPARPGAWRLIALGLGLLSVGDVTYTVNLLVATEDPYPSAADVPYLLGYVALVFGVVRLARGRMAGGDRIPMVDGAILAAGVSAVFWLVI